MEKKLTPFQEKIEKFQDFLSEKNENDNQDLSMIFSKSEIGRQKSELNSSLNYVKYSQVEKINYGSAEYDNFSDFSQDNPNTISKKIMNKISSPTNKNYNNNSKIQRISTQELVNNFHKKHSKSINISISRDIIVDLILKNLRVINNRFFYN